MQLVVRMPVLIPIETSVFMYTLCTYFCYYCGMDNEFSCHLLYFQSSNLMPLLELALQNTSRINLNFKAPKCLLTDVIITLICIKKFSICCKNSTVQNKDPNFVFPSFFLSRN